MQAISDPKTSYLLEAGLDVLYAETKEWQGELELMTSELRFYTNLLKSKVIKLEKEKQWERLLENMGKLSQAVTSELEQDVRSHEKELAQLLGSKSSDDARYRSRHTQLRKKVDQMREDIRTEKMLMFRFLEGKV